MHRSISRTVFAIVFTVLVVDVSGCWGPKRFDVTGQVKYNGLPLNKPDGQVVFVAANGTQVAASIATDGSYRASQVPAGPNRIAVYYVNPDLRDNKRFSKPKRGSPPLDQSTLPPPFLTPAHYASVQTSDLAVEVAEGTVFNIELTGPSLP